MKSTNSKSSDVSNEDIMKKLSGLDNLFTKIGSIETKFDDVKSLFNDLREKTEQIDNRLSLLESSSNNAFSTFSNHFHSVSIEINQLKQKAIENDFIMYGLPPNIKTEDLRAIFDAVGAVLGENLMVVKSFAISSKKKRECVVFGSIAGE